MSTSDPRATAISSYRLGRVMIPAIAVILLTLAVPFAVKQVMQDRNERESAQFEH